MYATGRAFIYLVHYAVTDITGRHLSRLPRLSLGLLALGLLALGRLALGLLLSFSHGFNPGNISLSLNGEIVYVSFVC